MTTRSDTEWNFARAEENNFVREWLIMKDFSDCIVNYTFLE